MLNDNLLLAKVFLQDAKRYSNGKRVYDKRQARHYCSKEFIKITRHLEDRHKDEKEADEALAL